MYMGVAILNKNVIFFFFYKVGEEEGRTGPVWGWYQWGEQVWEGKMCKYCAHVCVNGKMRPAETVPGMGGGEMKESDGGGEFSYDVLEVFVGSFVSNTVYPPHNNKKNAKTDQQDMA
jgi:hypothetical protein